MAFGMLGSFLGFASGGTYLLFIFFSLNKQLHTGTNTVFFFQFPEPIYDISFWVLGAIALLASFFGFIGSILCLYKPKVSSIMLFTVAVLGLGVIAVGYFISSLAFFVGSLISITEHRQEKLGLDLRSIFLGIGNRSTLL